MKLIYDLFSMLHLGCISIFIAEFQKHDQFLSLHERKGAVKKNLKKNMTNLLS